VSVLGIPFVVGVDEPKGRLEGTGTGWRSDGYTLSYQMYKCEHGLSAAEQRAADARAGEAAAALRELRFRVGRAVRPRRRVRSVRRAADAAAGTGAASTRLLSSGR